MEVVCGAIIDENWRRAYCGVTQPVPFRNVKARLFRCGRKWPGTGERFACHDYLLPETLLNIAIR